MLLLPPLKQLQCNTSMHQCHTLLLIFHMHQQCNCSYKDQFHGTTLWLKKVPPPLSISFTLNHAQHNFTRHLRNNKAFLAKQPMLLRLKVVSNLLQRSLTYSLCAIKSYTSSKK
mmetsp:Transcript_28514/g.56045  ORF Transcript_28514/g.56045 Transcript_28514/m.56045 type:complete len:114 (+) Transcript_28514:674-1015(+)